MCVCVCTEQFSREPNNECSLGVGVCVAGDFPSLNKQMFPWRVLIDVGALLVCEVLCV